MHKKIISFDNKEIKNIVKLITKSKTRREERIFVVEGQKEILMAIKNRFKFQKIYYNSNIIDINNLKFDNNTQIIEVNNEVYSKISFRNSTEGIIGLVEIKQNSNTNLNSKKINLALVLDGLEKPGNIGAILRSCDASAVDIVILTNEKCDIHNPNVIRSSIGTFFSNKVISMSNEEALEFLKNNNFKIYGTSLNATQYYNSIQYNSSTALIAGSENNGISDFWIKNSDILIKIPMLGMADSLNVSVSSAICLSEINRQNKFNR